MLTTILLCACTKLNYSFHHLSVASWSDSMLLTFWNKSTYSINTWHNGTTSTKVVHEKAHGSDATLGLLYCHFLGGFFKIFVFEGVDYFVTVISYREGGCCGCPSSVKLNLQELFPQKFLCSSRLIIVNLHGLSIINVLQIFNVRIISIIQLR